MASIYSVFAKLIRAGLAGVNPHTLTVGLNRAGRLQLDFELLSEQQTALTLLEQTGYPETLDELSLFLNVGQALTPASFLDNVISAEHAVAYMFWLPQFIISSEPHIQKNASVLLHWLVGHRQEAIAAAQECLDGLRTIAAQDDQHMTRKQAAFIAYALGRCGNAADAETVIRMAEYAIEHGRENVGLVSEAIYSLDPAGLINALKFFLNSDDDRQFLTGI